MADIKTVPVQELVDDYYASKLDKEAFERLGMPRTHDRIRGNAAIMEVIERELKRRGESHRIGG